MKDLSLTPRLDVTREQRDFYGRLSVEVPWCPVLVLIAFSVLAFGIDVRSRVDILWFRSTITVATVEIRG